MISRVPSLTKALKAYDGPECLTATPTPDTTPRLSPAVPLRPTKPLSQYQIAANVPVWTAVAELLGHKNNPYAPPSKLPS